MSPEAWVIRPRVFALNVCRYLSEVFFRGSTELGVRIIAQRWRKWEVGPNHLSETTLKKKGEKGENQLVASVSFGRQLSRADRRRGVGVGDAPPC